jgi:hypothetical protein
MKSWGSILAVVGLGVLAGGMLFFGAVMAPLVFAKLPLPVAGGFIRDVFPWYFGFCAASAAVALAGFLLRREWVALVPAFVMGASVWSGAWLLPVMDALKAGGDEPGFAFWHGVSTGVNGVELLAVLVVLVRLGAKAG